MLATMFKRQCVIITWVVQWKGKGTTYIHTYVRTNKRTDRQTVQLNAHSVTHTYRPSTLNYSILLHSFTEHIYTHFNIHMCMSVCIEINFTKNSFNRHEDIIHTRMQSTTTPTNHLLFFFIIYNSLLFLFSYNNSQQICVCVNVCLCESVCVQKRLTNEIRNTNNSSML